MATSRLPWPRCSSLLTPMPVTTSIVYRAAGDGMPSSSSPTTPSPTSRPPRSGTSAGCWPEPERNPRLFGAALGSLDADQRQRKGDRAGQVRERIEAGFAKHAATLELIGFKNEEIVASTELEVEACAVGSAAGQKLHVVETVAPQVG